jgi:hypothetical protein
MHRTGRGAWYWCGYSTDPGSGWHQYYVLRASGDCWDAARVDVEVGGASLEVKGRVSGCADEGETGSTMAAPDAPPGPTVRDVPAILDSLR